MTIDKQKLQKLLWAEVAAWSASSPDWLDNSQALEEFLGKQTLEEVALELLAENEALRAGQAEFSRSFEKLQAENELARMRIKELDLLFGRYMLAMRSALIEEEHGRGPAAAMVWIYNSLAGPGELPPESEVDSQAYFDREIVAVDRGMAEVMAFHADRRATMGKESRP